MSPFLRAVCCGLLLTTSCTDPGDATTKPAGGASVGASAEAGAVVTATPDPAAQDPPPPEPAPPAVTEATPEPAPPAVTEATPGPDAEPAPTTTTADAPPSPTTERKPAWTPWGARPAAPPREVTPPTTDLVTVRDPVEDAFTIGVPRGWDCRTHSVRMFDIHTSVLTAVSPNGSVLIFSGDPGLPRYWSPASATPVHHEMARVHPRMKIESFVPATTYFPDYVRKKFGALADFELLGVEDDPVGAANLARRFAEVGMSARATSARVSFRYTEAGRTMRALVLGMTIDGGAFWNVSVSGIATEGDPTLYVPMLEAIGRSYQTNPAWQREQQAKHEERMAQIEAFGRQLTAQHQQNMAAIQHSARLHQERMRALQTQSDASMQSYRERMASSDAQHQRFLNYIHDERTVVDSSGRTYQVDDSYQRYFVNKRDGTYVGGHAATDVEALRALGLDPSDYEEVKILR